MYYIENDHNAKMVYRCANLRDMLASMSDEMWIERVNQMYVKEDVYAIAYFLAKKAGERVSMRDTKYSLACFIHEYLWMALTD